MNIHNHYQKMKCVISADKSQPDKALSLIKDDFVVNLKDLALEHQEWHQNRLVGTTSHEAVVTQEGLGEHVRTGFLGVINSELVNLRLKEKELWH